MNNCKGCNETKSNGKLLFSGRRKLTRLYQKWQVENKVVNCPESVIGFLTGHGLIDTGAALKFIQKNEHLLDEPTSTKKK